MVFEKKSQLLRIEELCFAHLIVLSICIPKNFAVIGSTTFTGSFIHDVPVD
jgi:hypothetical protein